jgi:hypothetical protein
MRGGTGASSHDRAEDEERQRAIGSPSAHAYQTHLRWMSCPQQRRDRRAGRKQSDVQRPRSLAGVAALLVRWTSLFSETCAEEVVPVELALIGSAELRAHVLDLHVALGRSDRTRDKNVGAAVRCGSDLTLKANCNVWRSSQRSIASEHRSERTMRGRGRRRGNGRSGRRQPPSARPSAVGCPRLASERSNRAPRRGQRGCAHGGLGRAG